MDPLPDSPPLSAPQPGKTEQGLKTLYTSLFKYFTHVSYRVNRLLAADGSERMTGPLPLAQYATGDLPAAADYPGAIVYDSTTGQVKRSNGSSWGAL